MRERRTGVYLVLLLATVPYRSSLRSFPWIIARDVKEQDNAASAIDDTPDSFP
jgi:hypothetical protein